MPFSLISSPYLEVNPLNKINLKSTWLISTIIVASLSLQGCSSHKTEIFVGGLVGAAAGAGLGYGVVHHGRDRQYEVQNTLITSGVFAVGVMGVLALHYYMLEQQKVEIMSKLTTKWIDNPDNQNKLMRLGQNDKLASDEIRVPDESLLDYAMELDSQTRWVYPTFRKRELRPETSTDQSLSARYTWEIVRPGFFVNRETQPYYFEKDIKKKISQEHPVKDFDPAKEAVTP